MEVQDTTCAGTEETFIVLDIETAPPRSSLVHHTQFGKNASAHLHEITAIAILIATRSADAVWSVHRLKSWDRTRQDEFEILRAVNLDLAPHLTAGPTLVTFNGMRHDVPVIRRRAAFHRMFQLPTWSTMLSCAHRDLMMNGMGGTYGQWVSLKDTCDALAIPTDSTFADAAAATLDVARRKCETDVCSTFVLLLYTLGMERRNSGDLTNGWRSLSTYVELNEPNRPHLMQFVYAAEDQAI